MVVSPATRRPRRATPEHIAKLVDRFVTNERLVSGFLVAVLAHINQSDALSGLVHSIKHRIKDPEHLKDKLTRKAEDAWKAKKPFTITPDNLLRKVTDLAGISIFASAYEAI
jgi:ppGpp synthetase/RelA/SpoT-type nucleotidyltranferase